METKERGLIRPVAVSLLGLQVLTQLACFFLASGAEK